MQLAIQPDRRACLGDTRWNMCLEPVLGRLLFLPKQRTAKTFRLGPDAVANIKKVLQRMLIADFQRRAVTLRDSGLCKPTIRTAASPPSTQHRRSAFLQRQTVAAGLRAIYNLELKAAAQSRPAAGPHLAPVAENPETATHIELVQRDLALPTGETVYITGLSPSLMPSLDQPLAIGVCSVPRLCFG